MLSTKTFAAMGVYTIASFVAVPSFIFGAPKAEAWLAPVLTDQTISSDPEDRTPGRFCFTWSWNKRRYAVPIGYAWSLSARGAGLDYPAIARRERDGALLQAGNTAATGPGQQDLCVMIPREVDGVSGLTIKGQINYRTTGSPWTIWQDIPDIHVPPLSAS